MLFTIRSGIQGPDPQHPSSRIHCSLQRCPSAFGPARQNRVIIRRFCRSCPGVLSYSEDGECTHRSQPRCAGFGRGVELVLGEPVIIRRFLVFVRDVAWPSGSARSLAARSVAILRLVMSSDQDSLGDPGAGSATSQSTDPLQLAALPFGIQLDYSTFLRELPRCAQ